MNFKFLQNMYLQKLFNLFLKSGEQIYVVGGAVRDHFVGKESTDIDLATSMLPQNVINLLRENNLREDSPGLNFGTVRTFWDNEKYEITTFRQDTYEKTVEKNSKDMKNDKVRKKLYSRFPTVKYVKDPVIDAKRRDFTCNAIYVSPNAEIIDPYNGIEDIKNGVVKFIGNPLESVDIDPLRILRYFHLCAENFNNNIDETALTVCIANFDKTFYLSKRKFIAEYNKIMACRGRFVILNLWEQFGILKQIEEFVKSVNEKIEIEDQKERERNAKE